jgi:hypothetical protein
VVTGGVYHQAVEHALHLDFDLVQKFFEFSGLDELGDVVIGVKALARQGQPFADLDGYRRTLVGSVLGGRVGFHKHARYYQPAPVPSCPEFDRVFGILPFPRGHKQLSIW